MKIRRPATSLVSALAVAAVTLVALAAAWQTAEEGRAAARPSLQEPVQVVRAPAEAH